ncbi:MAG: molybdenum cofactor guanylyltransferase MobA [Comamonas sp.]|jgi:molybdopterin-guanine dinucleotide biosynthesis protein A|nr:molybdenum cofactor guanylyltransferase MobA [Comamonas sp.]
MDGLPLSPSDITGCVLAGGRGSRMGGVDKGLQTFHGQPLAIHALKRLAPQVGSLLINANRHADAYAELALPLGAQLCSDALPDYPGPLAGFLSGLLQCQTPWLLCIPCDTPLFPADLVAGMNQAYQLAGMQADIIIAHGRDTERAGPGQPPELRSQPVFCLLRTTLKDSLREFITSGGRKIDTWTGQHRCVAAVFDRPEDAQAFSNANTLTQLHDLEQAMPTAKA